MNPLLLLLVKIDPLVLLTPPNCTEEVFRYYLKWLRWHYLESLLYVKVLGLVIFPFLSAGIECNGSGIVDITCT